MEPQLYIAPPAIEPKEHWLKRAFVALVVDRRLPYRCSITLDKLSNAIGLRYKTVRANGFKVIVRRLTCDEAFVQNVIVNQEYTPPGFEIHESDTVIDIGGNIGTFSLLASRYASRGRVFTFEPNFENYKLLLHNITINRSKNIVPTCAAVTSRRGKVKLFCASEGGYHSLCEDRICDPEQYELVDSVGLKDIFDEHGIECCHFLKLDCEGAEYEILYNLPAEYYPRIEKIVMEYHGDEDKIRRRARSDALVAHLERMGYEIDAYLDFVGFRGGMIRAVRIPR
jgi:FkbM family methyltransferase